MQKRQKAVFFVNDNNDAYYLRKIMLIRILFWFIVFYFLFKFIIRVVLPIVVTTKNVRSKMKDMRQNMEEFESANQSTTPRPENFQKKEASPSEKGDYIDFEEIK